MNTISFAIAFESFNRSITVESSIGCPPYGGTTLPLCHACGFTLSQSTTVINPHVFTTINRRMHTSVEYLTFINQTSSLSSPSLKIIFYPTIFFLPKYLVNIKISAVPAKTPSMIPKGSTVIIIAIAIMQFIIESTKPHIMFLNNPIPPIILTVPQINLTTISYQQSRKCLLIHRCIVL